MIKMHDISTLISDGKLMNLFIILIGAKQVNEIVTCVTKQQKLIKKP
jgi:hypothetical protein